MLAYDIAVKYTLRSRLSWSITYSAGVWSI